jgi:hypothetical protein
MTAPGLITPTLGETLEAYAKAATSNLHVALPGTVLEYDPATNTADIELQVKDSYEDDDEEIIAEEYPTLIAVPIVFPRSRKAFFAWEVEKGDRVAVMFASQAIDQWLGSGVKSAPGDLRRHDLSHAFAVPGLYPMTEPVPAGDRQAGGAAIGVPGGPQIRFTPTGIKLGANATDGVALASKVDAEFTKLSTTIKSLAGQAAFGTSYVPASVASQKVRSE